MCQSAILFHGIPVFPWEIGNCRQLNFLSNTPESWCRPNILDKAGANGLTHLLGDVSWRPECLAIHLLLWWIILLLGILIDTFNFIFIRPRYDGIVCAKGIDDTPSENSTLFSVLLLITAGLAHRLHFMSLHNCIGSSVELWGQTYRLNQFLI